MNSATIKNILPKKLNINDNEFKKYMDKLNEDG